MHGKFVVIVLYVFSRTIWAATEPMGEFRADASSGVCEGIYVVGTNEIKLSHDAVRTYKRATRGDAAAQCEFAKILNPSIEPDDATPRVAAEAFAWAMRSAAQGYADGENYVGMSYKEGDGVPKNIRESEKWLSKAIGHGSAKAMCNLAILHIENGHPEKAREIYRTISVFFPSGASIAIFRYKGHGALDRRG